MLLPLRYQSFCPLYQDLSAELQSGVDPALQSEIGGFHNEFPIFGREIGCVTSGTGQILVSSSCSLSSWQYKGGLQAGEVQCRGSALDRKKGFPLLGARSDAPLQKTSMVNPDLCISIFRISKTHGPQNDPGEKRGWWIMVFLGTAV